jgi:hypothetical protein
VGVTECDTWASELVGKDGCVLNQFAENKNAKEKKKRKEKKK